MTKLVQGKRHQIKVKGRKINVGQGERLGK